MDEANQKSRRGHDWGHSVSLVSKHATTTLEMSGTGVVEEKLPAGRHPREHPDDYYYSSFISLVSARVESPISDLEGGLAREVAEEQAPGSYYCSPGDDWLCSHGDSWGGVAGGSWTECEEEGGEMVSDTFTFIEQLQDGGCPDSTFSRVLTARQQVLGTRQGTPRKERRPSNPHSPDSANLVSESDVEVVVADTSIQRVSRPHPRATTSFFPLSASCSESDAAVVVADGSGERVSGSHPEGTTTFPLSASCSVPIESYHTWEDNLDAGEDEDDGVSIFFIPSDSLHPPASVLMGLQENAHGEESSPWVFTEDPLPLPSVLMGSPQDAHDDAPLPSASVPMGCPQGVLDSCADAGSLHVHAYEMCSKAPGHRARPSIIRHSCSDSSLPAHDKPLHIVCGQ